MADYEVTDEMIRAGFAAWNKDRIVSNAEYEAWRERRDALYGESSPALTRAEREEEEKDREKRMIRRFTAIYNAMRAAEKR
jgi:hypothetical protein